MSKSDLRKRGQVVRWKAQNTCPRPCGITHGQVLEVPLWSHTGMGPMEFSSTLWLGELPRGRVQCGGAGRQTWTVLKCKDNWIQLNLLWCWCTCTGISLQRDSLLPWERLFSFFFRNTSAIVRVPVQQFIHTEFDCEANAMTSDQIRT